MKKINLELRTINLLNIWEYFISPGSKRLYELLQLINFILLCELEVIIGKKLIL